MVINKMVVTDENGVEHVIEGEGWFRARSQNYNGFDTEMACEAHITLKGDGLGQLTARIVSS